MECEKNINFLLTSSTKPYTIIPVRGSVGTGRRARLRILCSLRTCGFKSHLPHYKFLEESLSFSGFKAFFFCFKWNNFEVPRGTHIIFNRVFSCFIVKSIDFLA